MLWREKLLANIQRATQIVFGLGILPLCKVQIPQGLQTMDHRGIIKPLGLFAHHEGLQENLFCLCLLSLSSIHLAQACERLSDRRVVIAEGILAKSKRALEQRFCLRELLLRLRENQEAD